MRTRSACLSLAGGALTYVVVACTAAVADAPNAPGGDGGILDAMLDAVFDGPRDAFAGDAGGDGGSATPPSPDQYTSGSRLRASYATMVGSDGSGSRTFAGWYDKTLGRQCYASAMSDGTTRCVPQADAAATLAGYADPACTTALVVQSASGCAATPTFVNSVVASSTCGPSIWHAYQVSTEVTTPIPTYYSRDAAGKCSMAAASWFYTAANGYRTWSATELAPSALVTMTTTTAHE